MLKKTMAILFCLTMVLSSVQAAFAAEYEYSYGAQIAYKSYGTDEEVSGDGITRREMYVRGAEDPTAAYKLYDYDSDREVYTRKDSIATDYYFRLNKAKNTTVCDPKTNMFNIDTVTNNYGGKSFFSSSKNARASLEIKPGNGTFNKSSTMTYQFKIKYENNFVLTDFIISADGTRNINAFRIQADGTLASGPNSMRSQGCEKLELGKEYTIGVVLKSVPSETPGQYTLEKALYYDGTQIYHVNTEVNVTSVLKFTRFDVDCYPYTSHDFTYNSETPNITQTNGTPLYADNSGGVKYTDFASITTRYELISTKMSMNDWSVYAGDIYAETSTSLRDGDSKFHINSDIVKNYRIKDTPDNYNVIIEAETASTDTEATPVVLLATYNEDGALVNVRTGNITLIPGSITETKVTIPSTNEKKTVAMLLDSLGTLKPIAPLFRAD